MLKRRLMGFAKQRYTDAAVNIVFDGNSLVVGYGGVTATLPQQIAALAPISGALTIANKGVNAQTIADMTANRADITAAYAAGKTNILLILEGINSMNGGGRTAPQAISDLQAYLDAVNTGQTWRPVVLTCTPGYVTDQATSNALNARMDEFNDTLLSTYRAMGIEAVVDVRQAGSPFDLPNYEYGTFTSGAIDSLRHAVDGAGTVVHWNDAGYAVIAGYVATTLARLRSR